MRLLMLITPATSNTMMRLGLLTKNTNVTIEALPSSLPDAQIFYTIDGTDPTLESTKYEGVLNFTEPVTVKAVAIAEGYTLSEVATKEVEIKEQPKTPAISFEAQEGMSVVTITGETEGADLWYNFSEVVDTTKSMKYTEPFILKENKTVTAFAVAGGAVFSEPVSQRVVIKNAVVRLLVGVSRKSMIWKVLDGTPDTALNGTTVLHTLSLQKGASILRVHDVREAVETVRLMQKLNASK